MGGGNSKLNAGEAVAVPAKVRPILLRRFEELKKNRGAGKLQAEGTLSKKQLLKDAEEEDSDSQSSHGTETDDKVSTKETQLAKEEMGARVIATEKLSRVVPLPNPECEVEKERDSNKGNVEQDNNHNDHDGKENVDDFDKSNSEQDNKHNDHDSQEKVRDSKNKSNVEQDSKHNDHEDQEKTKDSNNKSNVEHDNHNEHSDHDDQEKGIHVDEKAEAEIKIEKVEAIELKSNKEQDIDAKSDDEDDESEQFGMFLPGSPSFRIYCIEAEKRQEEERKKHTIVMHQKLRSTDSVVSATSQLEVMGNLNEVLPVAEIEPTTKRKGNKARKFGAVRALLKVKSCYHPMCSCTGDERRHLIAAKAAN